MDTSDEATIGNDWTSVEGGAMPLTVARGVGAGAAIVILPSAFGVAPDLEEQMLELASDASLVVAIDPFFRDDPGTVPYADMARVMKRLGGLDRARTYRDLRAAIAWTRARTEGRPVVVLGICFGGPFALEAAADGVAQGVVSWHGTKLEEHLARAHEMRCPMRHHFGSVDPFVPRSAIDAFRAAFEGRDDVRTFVHEGATHGFSHRTVPTAFHPEAERAGMDSARALVSLDARVGGRQS